MQHKAFLAKPPSPDMKTPVTPGFPLYTYQQHDAIQEKKKYYLTSCLHLLAQEKGIFSDQETTTNRMGVVGLISQDLCFLCFSKLGSPRRAEPHSVPSSAGEQILNRTQAGLASWPWKPICSCICSPGTSLSLLNGKEIKGACYFLEHAEKPCGKDALPVLSHREADVTSLH